MGTQYFLPVSLYKEGSGARTDIRVRATPDKAAEILKKAYEVQAREGKLWGNALLLDYEAFSKLTNNRIIFNAQSEQNTSYSVYDLYLDELIKELEKHGLVIINGQGFLGSDNNVLSCFLIMPLIDRQPLKMQDLRNLSDELDQLAK